MKPIGPALDGHVDHTEIAAIDDDLFFNSSSERLGFRHRHRLLSFSVCRLLAGPALQHIARFYAGALSPRRIHLHLETFPGGLAATQRIVNLIPGPVGIKSGTV